ncbi:MAG: response regulator [Oligoflexales bacterium]|nr:response regulator [Oligoflexales bacterium]
MKLLYEISRFICLVFWLLILLLAEVYRALQKLLSIIFHFHLKSERAIEMENIPSKPSNPSNLQNPKSTANPSSESPSDDFSCPSDITHGNILYAEDDRDLREIISALLENSGFTVHSTSDGLELVKCFFENVDWPDIIISDNDMPMASGFDALKLIRKRRPDIPAVLLSGGMTFPELDAACNRLGIKFISKPVDSGEFVDIVRSLIIA